LFSLNHYDGDDRIKDFIFDLVSSAVDGHEKDYRNHTGNEGACDECVCCSFDSTTPSKSFLPFV